MLGILCLFSCLSAVFCGDIGITDPLLQYGERTSIAYGNNAFLARYANLGTPIAGAAVATPFAAHLATGAVAAPLAARFQEGIIAEPFAAHAGIAAPYLAAHTAYAGPVAAIGAAPVAAIGAAPVAAVGAAPVLAARTAFAAPLATVGAAPIAAHAAIAAPVATAAPILGAVEHVPAVAQVPVTKYEAQHAVIQDVVDVANPKLATRKFEIRRPAIQKQFYDIEERVVVKPAGSAVVELDQPISKNQRGPTVVSPAVEPYVASAPVRALPVAHGIHAQPILPAFPAIPVQSYPTFQQPLIPSVSVTPVPSQPIAPSTPRPDLDQPQFDDSESVSVENPEFGRARIAQQQQGQQTADLGSLQIQRFFEQSRSEADLRAQQEFQARARIQAQQRLIEEQQQIEQQQLRARARIQAQQQIEQQEQLEARARIQALQQTEQLQARARMQTQQQIEQLQARLNSQTLQRQSVAPAPVRENIEVSSRAGNLGRVNEIQRSSQQTQEIPSVRNLPEVEISNQARLIALLTERGPVSEVRSADGFDGRVRARVLSATPAPLNAALQDEKVNTRRVVVNRPIQTVQEVDVVEPFTKIERVAVHQPAVIKTARLGVANVPTALPVHTYTHAHYVV